MSTTIAGATTVGNVNSNQLAIEIGSQISLLEPNVQPLTVLTRDLKKETTPAVTFKWLEDERKARYDTLSAAVASTTATAIPVTHGSYFQQWDQVLNSRTQEQFRVDAVEGNTLVVARGLGSTAQAMNENDELIIIGQAQPENSRSKEARSVIPGSFENQTQIFTTPAEISRTAANVTYQVQPKEWDRKVQRAATEHAIDIESAFWFGRKATVKAGTTDLRYTAGALSFISTNQMDAGGILSESEFNAFMASIFEYGTEDKLAFMSSAALQALGKFPASKQVTKNDESTYGMNVTRYTGPFGTIHTVYHRLFKGAKYGGYMAVLDMQNITYRPLNNAETKLEPEIQPRDQDGKKAQYLTECGLEFGLQKTHGVMSGITG